jgi:PAS domain S-box-containing protein
MKQYLDFKKILVIDDEKIIRQSFAAFLEDQGFEVFLAENGRVGLELMKTEDPDLVLLDLRMPEMDGLEVLEKSRGFAADMPVIVISGANRVADVVRALRYGAWDYLEKPVQDFSILNHAVEKALEKARLVKENHAYQEDLKVLVKERTMQLEEANTHLFNINTRLHRIVETTQGLTSCMEMNQFCVAILIEFAKQMGATGGSLYMAEDDGLRLMHSLDPGHALEFLPFPLVENSVFKKVMKYGEPLLVKDITQVPDVEPSQWGGYPDGSLLGFPILDGKGIPIGVITLHSKDDPPFLEQDKEIGTILASYSCETLRAVRAFETVQKSEKQYRTLFEKSNDAIFIVEKNTGQYIDANEAAAILTGRSIEELKGLNTSDVIPENGEDKFLDNQMSDEAKDLGTIVYCRPNKSLRVAKVSIVPLDEKAVICIARDITQDIEIEKQLRQSQKMEAIGTLAGGIAHDFNNILSGILGYAQLLEMNIDRPDRIKNNIKQIVKGSSRASELVQQILTFSRQADHKKQPLKFYLIIKEAVKFLRSSIPTTIEIIEQINTKKLVLADATQVHQVVMNLCTNAYHAMLDTGGTLSVSLCDALVSAEEAVEHNYRPGSYIKLEIQDTGHGIDEKNSEKIFNPYFTTKNISKGTGLGLAVVEGIVKKHNGFIKVTSQLGSGTVFSVFFPVVEDITKQDPRTEIRASRFEGNETIMLVDDEIDILNPIQAILENIGYDVTGFMDGQSALEAFEKDPNRFDVVITDMTMPKMKGSILSKKILSIRKDIPVILCTGFHETFSEEAAIEAGICRYVQKPVTGRDLALVIREEMEKKSASAR